MAFTALLDACVLYPAPLRDLLLNLASTHLFKARLSDQIHEEWIRGVLRGRPDLAERLARTRRKMDEAVPDALVTGYEPLIDSISLPDPDDRHVVAAAITGRADVIVTQNLKDFPKAPLEPYNIDVQHPDEFIMHVMNLVEIPALIAIRAHRASLKKPPRTVEEYLDTLARQELPETVAFLRPRSELI